MIAEILTKDRPELIPPLLKRMDDVEDIYVVYTTNNPDLNQIDKMIRATKNKLHVVINDFDGKTSSYRYVWDILGKEDGLFLDDNVWFKPEAVKQIQEQLDNHREAAMITGWMKMGDYSNKSLQESSKPWKFFLVNNKVIDKVKPDIFLPKGMYDDKQLGIDSWLQGYPVYRDLAIELNRKNVGRPSGIIGLHDSLGGREELRAYKNVGWEYFIRKYPFCYLTKEFAVVVGMNRLKEIGKQISTGNSFYADVLDEIKKTNEAKYDFESHIQKIYTN
jgi:hypothetical protein